MSITSISCRQVIGNALSRMHMRCLGHTQRRPDERLVKQMLYGCSWTRLQGCPKL